MRIVMFRFLMLALGALAALMRPVTRAVVRLAGRLSYWRDQAEIGYWIATAEAKARKSGYRLQSVTVRKFRGKLSA